MRKLLLVCLALLVSSVVAASARAQDVSSANAGLNDGDAQNSSLLTVAPPEPAPAPQFGGNTVNGGWEMGVGFQYTDFLPASGTRFHNLGINTSVTRFFGEWFGIEGDLGLGFGNTGKATDPPNLTAKSLFVAGGPRIAYRSNSRWEPWGHFLFGLEHFRFTETENGYGSNSAFALEGGGGVDYHVTSRIAIRGEGDYLGAHFFKAWQRNLQVIGGVVLDF